MRESLYRPQRIVENLNEREAKKVKAAPRQFLPSTTRPSAFTPTRTSGVIMCPWPHERILSRSTLWYPETSFLEPRCSGTGSRVMLGSVSSMTSRPVSRGINPVQPFYPVYNRFHSPATSVPVRVIKRTAQSTKLCPVASETNLSTMWINFFGATKQYFSVVLVSGGLL